MISKQIIISSLGQKNIVLNKYSDEDDFFLIFGEQEFKMKSYNVEFISPFVSHLHQTEGTC